ncbi:hypothetical protein QLX08_000863 [Tetragonisca angustula]|uniref:CCHC-type domain-containing protein n=1 Tax=Tetragonisca angustula TaxID=166442 RepID=A0AAW1AKV2_9HYME
MITLAEVASVVASVGGCNADEVTTEEIRHISSMSMGSVWVQCPSAAIKRIIHAGKILVNWASVRVEAIATRSMQCFRCIEKGHVVQQCISEVDRNGRCYACGVHGHRARDCTAPAKWPVCLDLGRSADHRVGSKSCCPHEEEEERPAQWDKSGALFIGSDSTTSDGPYSRGTGCSR